MSGPIGSRDAPDGGAGGASQDKAHLFVFSAAKAGMQGVDRAHVDRVVYEMSRGSRFMANQERLDRRLQQRAAWMRERIRELRGRDLAPIERRVDARAAELERHARVLARTWAVVDMDKFFAAVHERDRPELRGRPMAVGGSSMLSTTNYEARAFGVRAAMPGFIALRLCPHLVIVPPDPARYREAAARTREVFARYDPRFAAGSLDEACLDLTDFLDAHGAAPRYHADCRRAPCPLAADADAGFDPGRAHALGCRAPEAVVREMRAEVRRRTRLTCSAGVAPNAMLAKIASDRNKPDGQFSVAPTREAVIAFVRALPVRKIPGIGRVTERLLREIGAETVADLHERRALLSVLFSPRAAAWLQRVSLGIARAEHSPPDAAGPGRKSISLERTFRAIAEPSRLRVTCEDLCAKLAAQMVRKGLRARTLTVKLKRVDFAILQRSSTFQTFTNDAAALTARAWDIIRGQLPIAVRLMGVKMHGFQNEVPAPRLPGQCSLEGFVKRAQGGWGADPAGHGTGPGAAQGPPSKERTISERDSGAADGCGVRRSAKHLSEAAVAGHAPTPGSGPGGSDDGGGGGDRGDGHRGGGDGDGVADSAGDGDGDSGSDGDGSDGDGDGGGDGGLLDGGVGAWLEQCLSQSQEGGGSDGDGSDGDNGENGDVGPGLSKGAAAAAAAVGVTVTRPGDQSPPARGAVDAPRVAGAGGRPGAASCAGAADDGQQAHCPLCDRPLGGLSNRELNWHLDLCLNRPIIRAAAAAAAAAAQAGERPSESAQRPRHTARPARKQPRASRKRARAGEAAPTGGRGAMDAFLSRGTP